jgi:4-amino-4-deoxy-L-arabinose transferase-like glycosyltransferase
MSLAKDEGATGSSPGEERSWSWAALGFAVGIWALSLPTFGLVVFLAPVGLLLSAVAWRRGPHDALFWSGFALNAMSGLSLLGFLIGVLTGDVGIGRE